MLVNDDIASATLCPGIYAHVNRERSGLQSSNVFSTLKSLTVQLCMNILSILLSSMLYSKLIGLDNGKDMEDFFGRINSGHYLSLVLPNILSRSTSSTS
ncbi:hypothetical protein MKW98_032708 [Papaver atlanticum]|uniref:Uncharacterized protein n=1 Tax=Papaver atlanticum TaxID=357466 RepID=A0AAD4TCU1_9MAGN|nr:hypothetical protein MKW98_032708 [Papaver atlanticum]